ncbi:hypothetical protein NFJ02_35g88570 [Pycnococcus provasolii]
MASSPAVEARVVAQSKVLGLQADRSDDWCGAGVASKCAERLPAGSDANDGEDSDANAAARRRLTTGFHSAVKPARAPKRRADVGAGSAMREPHGWRRSSVCAEHAHRIRPCSYVRVTILSVLLSGGAGSRGGKQNDLRRLLRAGMLGMLGVRGGWRSPCASLSWQSVWRCDGSQEERDAARERGRHPSCSFWAMGGRIPYALQVVEMGFFLAAQLSCAAFRGRVERERRLCRARAHSSGVDRSTLSQQSRTRLEKTGIDLGEPVLSDFFEDGKRVVYGSNANERSRSDQRAESTLLRRVRARKTTSTQRDGASCNSVSNGRRSQVYPGVLWTNTGLAVFAKHRFHMHPQGDFLAGTLGVDNATIERLSSENFDVHVLLGSERACTSSAVVLEP